MADICGDNRFQIIAKAKADIIESTNIETSADEMSVLDNILFRCWQMGWLNKYDDSIDTVEVVRCRDCKWQRDCEESVGSEYFCADGMRKEQAEHGIPE